MSEILELNNKIQILLGQLTYLRNENERLKRDLEMAYEKINLLEIKNIPTLFSPITNETICMKRIIPCDGMDYASIQHEQKKSGKKTSI